MAGISSVADMIGIPSAAADWWDPNGDGLCVWSAYQPKGAASQAASYLDLSGNGNDAVVGTAPTWNAVNGWIFTPNQYLTTTFVAQNDQSQSVIIQVTNVVGGPGARYAAGSRNAGQADRFYIAPDAGGGANVYYGNGGFVAAAPAMVLGNLAVAGNQGYRNGVADGAAIGAFGWVPDQPLYIGAINQSGGALNFFAGYIQVMAIYDCTLTAPQVSVVATAMAAL